MKWATGGWSFFIAENLILSENRQYLIDNLGDDGYHYLYGTISTAAMASVFYAYAKKVRGAPPLLWSGGTDPPRAAMVASFLLQGLGLAMASQSLPKLQVPVHYAAATGRAPVAANPTVAAAPVKPEPQKENAWKVRCPFDFTDSRSQTGRMKSPAPAPDGYVHPTSLDRVTRHPGLWAFGFVGAGNALLVPSIPQRVWMSMPLLVALIGGAHTDSRHRRGMGGSLSPELDAVTSNIPFLAMVTGKQAGADTQGLEAVAQSFREFGSEIKGLNAALAVGAAAFFVLRRSHVSGSTKAALSLTRY